jgi:glyoxylase-like metal-dependent hydrolase (beta-lactamase superfamily II)
MNDQGGGRPVYLKQLEMGPMQNFVYIIGCPETRECAVIDPAWDVGTVLRTLQGDDYRVTHAIITHCHPDHVNGLGDLLDAGPCRVHVQQAEAEFYKGLGLGSDLTPMDAGDEILVGRVPLRLLHTPGHTPGSQCFLVDEKLISGDTLFVGSCGRTDLPGGDAEEMYRSLSERLAALPGNTILYPGHNYGHRPTSTLGDERLTNPFLRFTSLKAFLRAFGL